MVRSTAASWSKCLAGFLMLQTAITTPVAPLSSGKLLPHYAPGKPVLPVKPGHLGAVSSESDICSHIGTDLLKLGGNAADALVGTVICVGVVGMYHSGE